MGPIRGEGAGPGAQTLADPAQPQEILSSSQRPEMPGSVSSTALPTRRVGPIARVVAAGAMAVGALGGESHPVNAQITGSTPTPPSGEIRLPNSHIALFPNVLADFSGPYPTAAQIEASVTPTASAVPTERPTEKPVPTEKPFFPEYVTSPGMPETKLSNTYAGHIRMTAGLAQPSGTGSIRDIDGLKGNMNVSMQPRSNGGHTPTGMKFALDKGTFGLEFDPKDNKWYFGNGFNPAQEPWSIDDREHWVTRDAVFPNSPEQSSRIQYRWIQMPGGTVKLEVECDGQESFQREFAPVQDDLVEVPPYPNALSTEYSVSGDGELIYDFDYIHSEDYVESESRTDVRELLDRAGVRMSITPESYRYWYSGDNTRRRSNFYNPHFRPGEVANGISYRNEMGYQTFGSRDNDYRNVNTVLPVLDSLSDIWGISAQNRHFYANIIEQPQVQTESEGTPGWRVESRRQFETVITESSKRAAKQQKDGHMSPVILFDDMPYDLDGSYEGANNKWPDLWKDVGVRNYLDYGFQLAIQNGANRVGQRIRQMWGAGYPRKLDGAVKELIKYDNKKYKRTLEDGTIVEIPLEETMVLAGAPLKMAQLDLAGPNQPAILKEMDIAVGKIRKVQHVKDVFVEWDLNWSGVTEADRPALFANVMKVALKKALQQGIGIQFGPQDEALLNDPLVQDAIKQTLNEWFATHAQSSESHTPSFLDQLKEQWRLLFDQDHLSMRQEQWEKRAQEHSARAHADTLAVMQAQETPALNSKKPVAPALPQNPTPAVVNMDENRNPVRDISGRSLDYMRAMNQLHQERARQRQNAA